jgi:hypothetical protein
MTCQRQIKHAMRGKFGNIRVGIIIAQGGATCPILHDPAKGIFVKVSAKNEAWECCYLPHRSIKQTNKTGAKNEF